MNQHKRIYWIGGSPCSGKSTIAEKLVKEFGFAYYKCDDHLDRYMKLGAAIGKPTIKKMSTLNIDETWLRPVDELVQNEFSFYEEAFNFIIDDISNLIPSNGLVVEGAALLPENMASIKVPEENYICIVPSAEFQVEKYKEREWVSHYLRECSDSQTAFSNWMQRDIRFAEIVNLKATHLGYKVSVTDGKTDIGGMYKNVLDHFNLSTSSI